jgi:hypothetical protein
LVAALEKGLDAIDRINGFLDDLAKSNPGYLRKLSLQRYDLMNEAFIATEQAPGVIRAALAKGAKS